MKIKNLMELLSKQNPEHEVYFSFNGCLNSGDMLDISDLKVMRFAYDKNIEDEGGNLIGQDLINSEDFDLSEEETKLTAICLYSDRFLFYPEDHIGDN